MLEIPEAATVAGQLTKELVGKRIVSVEAGHTPHGFAWYHGDPAGYPSLLEGRAVDRVQAFGGRVDIGAGGARISFNDGVNVRYLQPGAKPPAKHQFYLGFDDGSAIACTVQMYGGMLAFLDGELDDNFYYTVARDKPHPLSDAFDADYFDQMWGDCKQTLSAKAFLATEQRIPGLGNGVLQDILFRAGIHPKTKLQHLGNDGKDRMLRSVKSTLEDMTNGGGRDTEKDIYGNPGGYRCNLSKNTLPYPCPQCGGSIRKQAYLGGAVYFCPTCQPELK